MYYAATTSDPLTSALDIDLVATHLRLGPNEESTEYLAMLVRAAMQWAEGEANQPLFLRGYVATLTGFTGGTLRGVALGPVVAIGYRTTAGVDPVPLAATGYQLTGNDVTFLRAGLPGSKPYNIEITYTAGYAKEDMPDDLRLALLAHIGYSYEQRANPVTERYTLAEKLLAPYKLYNC